MKRHTIEVRFATSEDGKPTDVPGLLQELAEVANNEMPYTYRVDTLDPNAYTLVPTTTKNAEGQEDALPLLDRKITIPFAKRMILQDGNLLAEELSKHTGLHVGCCDSSLTGVPWGTAEIEFGADDKPAREILCSLISLEQKTNEQSNGPWHGTYNHWVVRCDGTGAPWCSIQVQGLTSCRYWRNPTEN